MRRSGQANHRESLRSAGEIEAEVGRAIVGFLQETHGRGAREISVHLHRDTVPLGGSGRRVFAGEGRWRESQADRQGAGGELSGVVSGTRRHRALST